jgi:glycosidase
VWCAGLIQRLDYLASLQAGGLVVSAPYPSTDGDLSNELTDFMDIDPNYGDLGDFRQLINASHARGR